VPGEWTHRWGAATLDEDGDANAWLELRWEEPVRVGEVQLTFDSGFHRELTLSASDAVTARTVRGPQPETVRDYRLVASTPTGEVELADVRGNHQRLRRHRFEPVELSALRLHVLATNGAREVRVFELRCYA
jgi:hypothetical protein